MARPRALPVPAPVPPQAAYYPAWQDAPSVGAGVHLLDLPGKAMSALRMSWPCGAAAEPVAQCGISSVSFLAALSGHGGECTRALERFGAEATASVSSDSSAITLVTPACFLDETAALIRRALDDPTFADADVENARVQVSSAARETLSKPIRQAGQALQEAMYGGQSGFARHPGGTPEVILQLTPKMVREHYQRVARPAVAQLFFVGDIRRSRAAHVLGGEGFAAMRRGPALAPSPQGTMLDRTDRSVLVGRPGARQPVLACGRLVKVASQREVAALEAAVQILAGWHGSRWHVRLREKEGLTYGVSAEFTVRNNPDGYLCEIKMFTAVAPGEAGRAARLMSVELNDLARGRIERTELRQAVTWVVQSQKLYLQTPDQIAALHSQFIEWGHPVGFGRARAELLTALIPAEVADAARQYLTSASMNFAGVGDPDQLAPAFRVWNQGSDDSD